MASKRLLDKRREHEAAEKQGKVKKEVAPKKGARKAPARKRKTKAPERKRLMWGVFSGTLKEEGRYNYDERDKAEEKLALLRSKSKKQYFIQPIKESLNETSASKEDSAIPADEEEILDDDVVAEDEDEDGDAEDFDEDAEEE